MKSLSFEQMAQVEGGNSGYCDAALRIFLLGIILRSGAIFLFGLAAASAFCRGGGGDTPR